MRLALNMPYRSPIGAPSRAAVIPVLASGQPGQGLVFGHGVAFRYQHFSETTCPL